MIKDSAITIAGLTKHLETTAIALRDAEHLLWATWLLSEDRGELSQTDIKIMSLINIEKGLLEGLHRQINTAIDIAMEIERKQTRGDKA